MNLQDIYEIFTELENESSKTGKEAILRKHEGNEDFRKALNFLLNPYVITGLSTKKINKKNVKPKGEIIGLFVDLSHAIDWLTKYNTGTDNTIYMVQKFMEEQKSDELKTFIKKFVTKTLKVGISAKTVNKVYGKGTIPAHEVMLADSYAKKEHKVTGKFYITLKLDGNRCTAFHDEDGVKFMTRQGKPVDGLVELEEQFKELPYGAYDGELLLINKENLPSDELFRATQKVVRKDGTKKDIDFHIFDMLPVSEFQAGKSKKTYEQRRNTLNLIEKDIIEQKNLHLLPVLYEGEDKNMIAVLMKWAEENGHEGLMVNTANGLYVGKRTTDLLKVKTMKTADLLVMSVEKAIDGQFEGLLSRVNVEFKGNLVGVGSGFTLEQRREFIEDPDLIAGKIIEVQYFEESKDEKTGLPSLRFPVFKGIRDDKTVEDINYE